MGRLISTLALVAVLAGLGAYIYFVDSGEPASGTEVKAKAFSVVADDIEELRIAIADGDTSTLKRVERGWELTDPVQAEADSSELENMASVLSSLEVQRVVDEAPVDLAPFGLATPHLEVSFRAKGSTTFNRLLIGEKTPTGGDVYAKKPDEPRIFLLSAFVDDTFKRSAFDLRDKTILKFDRNAVTALELVNASGAMRFERKGANWMFVEPRPMRADFATLESTITSLSATLMQKFVADDATPAELAEYGLARPSASATIVTGDSRIGLLLGRTDNAETYARETSKPAILMVAPTIVGDLKRNLDEFRRREVFDLKSFSTTRLQVQRGPESMSFEKSTVDGKDVWKSGTGAVVDTAKVEDLLTRLSGVRTATFAATTAPALRTPVLVVTASFGENKDENLTETVTLARAGERVVASRPDEPGTLEVEGAPLDDILKAIDALK